MTTNTYKNDRRDVVKRDGSEKKENRSRYVGNAGLVDFCLEVDDSRYEAYKLKDKYNNFND